MRHVQIVTSQFSPWRSSRGDRTTRGSIYYYFKTLKLRFLCDLFYFWSLERKKIARFKKFWFQRFRWCGHYLKASNVCVTQNRYYLIWSVEEPERTVFHLLLFYRGVTMDRTESGSLFFVAHGIRRTFWDSVRKFCLIFTTNKFLIFQS